MLMSRILFYLKKLLFLFNVLNHWIAHNCITHQFSNKVNRNDKEGQSYDVDPFCEAQANRPKDLPPEVGEYCL